MFKLCKDRPGASCVAEPPAPHMPRLIECQGHLPLLRLRNSTLLNQAALSQALMAEFKDTASNCLP